MLSITEVAKQLNVSRSTVYGLVKSGKLKALEITPTLLRIEQDALNEYIKAVRNKPSIRQRAADYAFKRK